MTQTIRVLAKGGVIAPGDLYKLCQVARESGCETLGLSSRQEVYMRVTAAHFPAGIEGLVKTGLPFDPEPGRKANIVTSYGATGMYPATPWLLAGTYLDILEQFDYQPRLKINLTDPQQPLIPRFSGELNFIASPYPTFWHLYVQLPAFGSHGQLWPAPIGSEDIARLCYAIEQLYCAGGITDLGSLVERVAGQLPDLTTRPVGQPFHVPTLPFPAYEGFHESGAGYWLGIYRRDYAYPLAFVEALCGLALRGKIGKLCLTPWRTFLIKDIRPEHRPHWEKLLGVHHVGIHHAANELNWQLPDLDEAALRLKKRLVRDLEETECNTTGLSFAIGLLPMPVATSVVIEPEPGEAGSFTVRHTADFTRSNTRWRVFARQVSADHLAQTLRELCMHYHTAAPSAQVDPEPDQQDPKPAHADHLLYQCTQCLTVYDPQWGDPGVGVPSGVPFAQLPGDYACSLCEGHKEDFVQVMA
ncbi:MAG: Rubredoxin [uncultured Cytophagales bacterium]|uniref:Rubredoxin n=1 Tax=uncultured Cytophagales bacterium TaxID=158755 RepID=A0A6J4LN26_9SPHI|nr:MAG: Rubredoxin [uncultured Cytophagales bacterium]